MDLIYGTTESPEKSLRRAEECVQKAIWLDDSTAEAHAYLGQIYLTKRQYEKAIAEGEQAFALSPNSDFVQAALALCHESVLGRPTKEAIPIFQKAIRFNPDRSPTSYLMLGGAYRVTGHFEEAVLAYKKALLLSPDMFFVHLSLAATYIEMGREKEARAEAAEALKINPRISLDHVAKLLPYKDQSENDRYIEVLRKAGLK